MRVNVSQVTNYSPGALAFRRDMLFDVPTPADLERLRDKRRLEDNENLRRINSKGVSYD